MKMTIFFLSVIGSLVVCIFNKYIFKINPVKFNIYSKSIEIGFTLLKQICPQFLSSTQKMKSQFSHQEWNMLLPRTNLRTVGRGSARGKVHFVVGRCGRSSEWHCDKSPTLQIDQLSVQTKSSLIFKVVPRS